MSIVAYALAHPRCGECRMPTLEDALLACPDCRLELCEYCHGGEHTCGDDPLSLGQEELIRRQHAQEEAGIAVDSARKRLREVETMLAEAVSLYRSVSTDEATKAADLLDEWLSTVERLPADEALP